MFALDVMNRQTLLSSLLWVCFVTRLMDAKVILKIKSTSMFFPLGNTFVPILLRTSFILSSRSWEIGNRFKPGRMELFCVAPISDALYLTHSYILKRDHPPQCEHCQCILIVSHGLVECNQLVSKKDECIWWMRCGGVIWIPLYTYIIISKRMQF